MEQTFINESLGEEKMQRLDTPVSIHVHSIRKRLTDADGVSAKATIDGLVHAGLLQDDSPEFVKEVSYSQEKGKEEETIITITGV
jgi:Holliday junction resolvase RusA-like endonuclease